MKHSVMKGLIGSLLVFSCSIAFAEQATLELTQGATENLSGYSANGAISARSAYSADQADPNAISDAKLNTPSVDNTQSAAISESPEAMAVWVTVQGTVRNDDGKLVCAMALANGQYMFTCNPLGAYSLTVPLDSNNQIDLQVFAAGHMPFRQKLPANQAYYGVILEVAKDCDTPPPTEWCGNGFCGVGENYSNCPADCAAPPPTEWCGNGFCGVGEDYNNCPADCAAPEWCGNGFCGIGEDYNNCPADCAAPPPATSNITIDMIDKCPDGLNIDYKHYDPINDWVWPSSTNHYFTPGYGLRSSHTLTCENDGKVCFGGRSNNLYWGVDVDGSKSCSNCCMPCENKTWTWELTCN